MVKSPRAIVPAVAGAILLLGACDPSTVEIRFDPEVGSTYDYRSEIRTEFERVIDDEVDTRGAEHTILSATEEVIAVDGDEITLQVSLERDGLPARSHSVQLRRGDHLSAIDLITDDAAQALGLPLTTDLAAPPPGPLRVGLRWDIDELIEVAGDDNEEHEEIAVTGTGRIRTLGVHDGRDVAIVEVTLEMPIRSRIMTADGQVQLSGTQTTESASTYDLRDGTLRAHRRVIAVAADLVVDPPEGVMARSVPGWLTYRLHADTTRVPLD